jgi:hypothetical protein
LNYESVIVNWKEKILVVENDPNPRVREFFEKIQPTNDSLINGHLSKQMQGGGLWWIDYSFDLERQSYEYALPNAIDWSGFPEMKRAHRIVEENLAAINSKDCYIPKTGLPSATVGKQWGPENPAWFIDVPLTCPDSLKTASVKINPDGSFEWLRITWETRTK